MQTVALFLGAYPRIHAACRARGIAGDGSGVPALSDHQAAILAHLDEHDPVMVGEIAEVMGVTASTMSLNLTRLERDGFVRRERDPDDRRVKNVRLTAVGREMRDRSRLLDVDRVDALLASLRPDDRKRALEGLAILAEASDRMVARGSAWPDSLTEWKDAPSSGVQPDDVR